MLAIYNELEWLIEPDAPQQTEEGWDTVTRKQMIYEPMGDAAARARFAIGMQITGYDHMYVTQSQVKRVNAQLYFYEVTLSGKGLLQTKPFKFRFITLGERNTYKQVIIPGYTSAPGDADVAEPRVGVNVKWISTLRPSMALVGKQVYPPDVFPDVPDNIWGSISAASAIHNVPKFHVLDSRTPEQLPGTEVWLVDDTISYYWPVKPPKG